MKQWSLDARSSRQSCPSPEDQTGHRDGERKGRPSLDARSLAQPCYPLEELHRPWGREKIEEDRVESVRSMREVGDSPPPFTFKYQPLVGEGKKRTLT